MSARATQIASVEKRIDNLIGAMQLPMPPALHLEQLKAALPEIRDTLRLIYIAESGDDPWAPWVEPVEGSLSEPPRSDKATLPAESSSAAPVEAVEVLRADAERYRWLRHRAWGEPLGASGLVDVKFPSFGHLWTGEQKDFRNIDRAVDAAIKDASK